MSLLRQKQLSIWCKSPCSLAFVTHTFSQEQIKRFTVNSIYHKDDPHKPKRTDQNGQPFHLLKEFRKQIREASRTGHQDLFRNRIKSKSHSFLLKNQVKTFSKFANPKFQCPSRQTSPKSNAKIKERGILQSIKNTNASQKSKNNQFDGLKVTIYGKKQNKDRNQDQNTISAKEDSKENIQNQRKLQGRLAQSSFNIYKKKTPLRISNQNMKKSPTKNIY